MTSLRTVIASFVDAWSHVALVAVWSVIAELLASADFVSVAFGVLVAVDDSAKSELVVHRNLKSGTSFVHFFHAQAFVCIMRVGSSVAT